MVSAKIGPKGFINITQTPQIKRRLSLARSVINGHKSQVNNFDRALASPATRQIRRLLAEKVSETTGIYLCSGGDVSSFVAFTGYKSFFAIDRHPLINPEIERDKLWPSSSHGDLLKRAITERRIGWYANKYINEFGETGIFAFLDILGMGGNNLSVLRAERDDGSYTIVFDFQKERYCVHFIKEELQARKFPGFLEELPMGFVLLKGGRSDAKSVEKNIAAYLMLEAFVDTFPASTIVAVDHPIETKSRLVHPVPFDSDIPTNFSFGYQHLWLYQTSVN